MTVRLPSVLGLAPIARHMESALLPTRASATRVGPEMTVERPSVSRTVTDLVCALRPTRVIALRDTLAMTARSTSALTIARDTASAPRPMALARATQVGTARAARSPSVTQHVNHMASVSHPTTAAASALNIWPLTATPAHIAAGMEHTARRHPSAPTSATDTEPVKRECAIANLAGRRMIALAHGARLAVSTGLASVPVPTALAHAILDGLGPHVALSAALRTALRTVIATTACVCALLDTRVRIAPPQAARRTAICTDTARTRRAFAKRVTRASTAHLRRARATATSTDTAMTAPATASLVGLVSSVP